MNPETKGAVAQPASILIVDDNHDNADSLALCLRLTGYESHTAYDGEEAWERVALLNPAVVLVDLAMPKLDGCGFAERVRRDSQRRSLFLIALTGFADEPHRALCAQAGFDLFLVKPVDPDSLDRVLKSRIGL